jgi:hypothetical protein
MPRNPDSDPLIVALDYLEKGWSVIPIEPRGKKPLVDWKPFQTRRPPKDELREWFRRDANVGIVTGSVSGLIVLDIDPRHGGDATLQGLVNKYGDLPVTVGSKTGGGGRHIFLAHPGKGIKIASKAAVLGPGIDIRADGGYVVAPPSLHASGNAYEWEPQRSPNDVKVAPAPSWLLSELGVTLASSKRFELPAVINEGQRNDTLYRYARHLKGRSLERKVIHEKLMTANRGRCRPPLPIREVHALEEKALTQPDRHDFQPKTTAQTNGISGGDLPTIVVTNREFRDVVSDALRALVAANDPPTLFQRGGQLTRVKFDERQTPSLETLFPASLRCTLARVANWRRITQEGRHVPTPPPNDIVADILALNVWEKIPPLQGLVEAPTFAPDGTLLAHEGYHPGAQVWFHRAPDFTVPVASLRPSRTEIQQARDLIMKELLGDFPFDTEASRAHALAAMLLPFAREMIAGPTPLHLIDAPAAGTGKGLLADVMSLPASGRGTEVMAEGQDDEEWRKRITAVLVKGPTFVMVDNVARRLDSAALAAALTGSIWTDRILGKTATVTLPNRAVWLATGNNIAVSTEMARRSVWMRLDARTDMPWKRTDFRHLKLRVWAQENRSQLVHACLTLVQGWIAAGRPPGKAMLGSFEAWAETMSGILEVAEVPGFLANAERFYTQADEENQDWRAFVLRWWEEHHDGPVGIDDLFDIADDLVREDGLLVDVLGDGGDRSKRTRLGKAIARLRDRVFVGYRIEDGGEDHRGRRRYRLRPVTPGKQTNSADVPPTSRRRSPQTSAEEMPAVMLD